MPCIPDSYTYGGIDLPGVTWQNWAGTVRQRLGHWFSAASLTDVVDVVRRATTSGVEVHAAGSGWAFEDVAVSADWVISLAALNRSLTYVIDAALTDEWRAAQADPAGRDRLFHVEAGITIGSLNQLLADAGLAMPTLGGANGQSLAGAISTSTHGGDIRLPPLADVVQAVHS
jgi:FAD/FMN-containing dehydrogenase